MNIYLVRHGQTESNVDKTLLMNMPDHAVQLTAKGREQAATAGKYIRGLFQGRPATSLRIWHSPYVRARQTAEEISKRVPWADVCEHILLAEQQFGLFDGIPDDKLPIIFPKEHAHYEKHVKFKGAFWARMPQGESRFDVAARVHQAFGTFHRDAERHGIQDLVVVCHGVVIRAFVMMWCHMTVEWFEDEPNPGNGSIRLIDSEGVDHGYILGRTSAEDRKAEET